MFSKWELARYLIDAKRSIDSLMYIDKNRELLRFLDIHALVRTKEREFYLDCYYVLDTFFSANPNDTTRNRNKTIKRIYVERNKNVGHKDYNYEDRNPKYLIGRINRLKERLECVRNVCGTVLPDCVTLDYVTHDPILYRLAEGITADTESLLGNKLGYIGDTVYFKEGGTFTIFRDTETNRRLVKEGITHEKVVIPQFDGLNYCEKLQNFQDAALKLNVLTGKSLWCSLNIDAVEFIEQCVADGRLPTLLWGRMDAVTDPKIKQMFNDIYRMGVFEE